MSDAVAAPVAPVVIQPGDVWVPALIIGTLLVILVGMCIAQFVRRAPRK